MARLDGKVGVVTGGSSGMGLAIAQRFAEEGANTFITGRRQAESSPGAGRTKPTATLARKALP